MKQEKRISYKAGITRTPSDFLCADGELAECINLVTDSEELKPTVAPGVAYDAPTMGTGALYLLYVHRYNNTVRYICCHEQSTGGPVTREIVWHEGDNTTVGPNNPRTFTPGLQISGSVEDVKVTSIGKTLIITDNDGMHYAIWRPATDQTQGYKRLSDTIPDTKFEFWLYGNADPGYSSQGAPFYTGGGMCAVNTGSYNDIANVNLDILDQEKWNELVTGIYAKNVRTIAEKGGFCKPFFVRTAIRLTGGSYTHISQPVLLFPSIRRNTWFDYFVDPKKITAFTKYCYLNFSQSQDLSDWSDIVEDIDVFVSDGIDLYDLIVDQPVQKSIGQQVSETLFDGIFSGWVRGDAGFHISKHVETTSNRVIRCLKEKTEDDIKKGLEGTRLFYKICSVGLGVIDGESANKYMESHTLDTLVNQSRLDEDDFYSRCKLFPKFQYAYNARLNIANVSRGFFDGFESFIAWDTYTESADVPPVTSLEANDYRIFVTIDTDSGEVVVEHDVTGHVPTAQEPYRSGISRQGIWFFYPDRRAKKVKIVEKRTVDSLVVWSVVLDTDLTEHPGLNGAYYFAGLPGSTPDTSNNTNPQPTTGAMELLPNYIITSEVNNPWVFKSGGYQRVSTGEIIGMATQAVALGQEEHGIHPLIVFTTRGLYSLRVSDTGTYLRVDEMPREVCINRNCILETDGAVYFVSRKGLMVIVGNQARCVSSQMDGMAFDTASLAGLGNGIAAQDAPTAPWAPVITACQGGRTFQEFISDENCFMAYDYRNSRILICNMSYDTVDNTPVPRYRYCYAYGIADGSITKVIPDGSSIMTRAVNDYPDYLLQDDSGKVWSLYSQKREEEILDRQRAFILTRPMKLSAPLVVASLRELVNVGMWRKKDAQGNALSCVKTDIWVSDDLQAWYPYASRFGAAAKYYRIGLYIYMLPTERLSGTIIREEPRRTDNLRA